MSIQRYTKDCFALKVIFLPRTPSSRPLMYSFTIITCINSIKQTNKPRLTLIVMCPKKQFSSLTNIFQKKTMTYFLNFIIPLQKEINTNEQTKSRHTSRDTGFPSP